MANARVIAAIRKIAAICRHVPPFREQLPRVRMEGATPHYVCVEDLVCWLHDHFLPDSDLQFAFVLGSRAKQNDQYGLGALRSEAPAELVRQANNMLQLARARRPPMAPGEWQSEAEWKLEERVNGRTMSAEDLSDPGLRKHFLEAVTPYFAQLRHPSQPSSPQIDV